MSVSSQQRREDMSSDVKASFGRRTMILSTLWIFVLANYLYADIEGLMDHKLLHQYLNGVVNNLHITPAFLLGSAILVEIPIAMILLSRVLPQRANRLVNIIAGTVMTVVQFVTLFVGTGPTLYYVFASVVEIAGTAFIVWYAVTWRRPEVAAEVTVGATTEVADSRKFARREAA
jgi:arginine exporter protein ArgO